MTREVSVEQAVLSDNARDAELNRAMFAQQKVYVLNLMSGAGAGKTTLLERTVDTLRDRVRIAVIAGDLETRRDADRIARHGVPVVQINTGGACHIEAHQIATAAAGLELGALDLLIIENVGNLVCPAEFPLGETDRAMILSTTEGHDKPAKYPLMFKESRALILNKIDLLPYTNFDMAAAIADARALHPELEVFPLSARTGEGFGDFMKWLEARVVSVRRQPKLGAKDAVCLAIPMLLVSVEGPIGKAEVEGVRREVMLDLVPEAKIGDYVIVHAGYAIQTLDQNAARETLDLLARLSEASS